MIIGIVGKKNVGKDLVADLLVKKGFIKLSFASILKNAAKELFNWDDHQVNDDKEKIDPKWNITPREVLQLLGTEFLREKLGNKLNNEIEFNGNKKDFSFHVKNLFLKNKDIILSKKNIVISDIRFKDEYNFVKWIGGNILKINRNIEENEFSDHLSENNLDDTKDFDWIIDNNFSISHLQKTINLLINEDHC
jgi:hypothetical protein